MGRDGGQFPASKHGKVYRVASDYRVDARTGLGYIAKYKEYEMSFSGTLSISLRPEEATQ